MTTSDLADVRRSTRIVAVRGSTIIDLQLATFEAGRAGAERWLRIHEGMIEVDLRLDGDEAIHGEATIDGVGGSFGRQHEIGLGTFQETDVPRLAGTVLRLSTLRAPTPSGLRVVDSVVIVVGDDVLAYLLAPVADPEADIDEAAFTEIFADIARRARPEITFVVAEPLRITLEGALQGEINLHNAWVERPSGQRALARHIRRFATSLVEPPVAATRSAIVPLVRSGPDLAAAGAGVDALVSRPFVADLVVAYAIDRPDSLQNLNVQDLAGLGLTVGELEPIALANLIERAPEVELHGDPAAGRLMLVCGGVFEASMMVRSALWDDIATLIGAPPVVVVGARDLVLVAREADLAARSRHVQIAEEVRTSGARPVSRIELVWKEGRWAPVPAPDRDAKVIEVPQRWRPWPLPSALALGILGACVPWGPGAALRPFFPVSVHASNLVGIGLLLVIYSQWQGLMDEHPRRVHRVRAQRREWAMWAYTVWFAAAGIAAIAGNPTHAWAMILSAVALVSELISAREDRRRVED